MKIIIYVLHGSWDDLSEDGVTVLGVSDDITPLQAQLDGIAENKAGDFVEMHGYIHEERDKRYYEAVDVSGKYAKFYITEHGMEISGKCMGEISREAERNNLIMDIEGHLQNLHEAGSISTWVYEYMEGNRQVMEEILGLFEKLEDCNTPYNVTKDTVIGKVIKSVCMDDEKLEYLWEKFGGVPVDDDGFILDDFLGFKSGIHREEIWRWFDGRYSGGVAKLMYGVDNA